MSTESPYPPLDVGLQTFLVELLGQPVYPRHIPEGKPYPALTYTRITSDRPVKLSGPVGAVFARVPKMGSCSLSAGDEWRFRQPARSWRWAGSSDRWGACRSATS